MSRIDPLLVLGAASMFAGCAVLAPVAASFAALGVVWLIRKRCPAGVVAAALLAWGLGWGRGALELSRFETDRVSARPELGADSRCALVGRVVSSPEWLHGSLRYLVQAERLECEKKSLNTERVLRLYGGPQTLARGDRIEANVQLGPLQLFRNVDVADPTPLAARKEATLVGGVLSVSVVEKGAGLSTWIDGLRAAVRERILATFSTEAEALARALVLGENDLSVENDAAFKQSGLAHLLAVSGTHLVFAVVLLVGALRAVLVRVEAIALRVDVARLSAAFGAVLALLYADFAGGSGSAFRAAWMLVAAFAARALGRKPKGQRILGVTMCVGAAFDPLVAFDISFLLSLAATVGLILWSSSGTAAVSAQVGWRSFAVVRFVEAGGRATLSALLPCVPILALMSDQVSVLGVVANLVAGPIGEIVALPVCLLHAACSFFPVLEQGLALVGSGALLAVSGVAHITASQSCLALPLLYPTAWHRVVVLLAAVAWLVLDAHATQRVKGAAGETGAAPAGVGSSSATGAKRATYRWVKWLGRPRFRLAAAALAALTLVEFATLAQASPKGRLRIMSLDVGQGDSALVDLPDGRLMLIDGGGFVGSPVDPGVSVILPALRARRRSVVDFMVLSHPHPDHFLGLISVAKNVKVREFWTTSEGEAAPSGPYMELLRLLRQQGTKVRYPPELCERPLLAGGARIEVLAPCPDFNANHSANDNSIVLKFQHGRRVALSVGDAEAAEESELALQFGPRLKADWLKVGHHGSRTSSTAAFLEAANPAVAVISTGVRNRFGHPHADALERLRAAGVAVFRTDLSGSVVWETDGNTVNMWAFAAQNAAIW